MKIGRISVPPKVQMATLGTLFAASVVGCINERENYANTLRQHVKENSTEEMFQYYENRANQFGVSKVKVYKHASDSIDFAHENYFIGSQSVKEIGPW